MRAIFVIFNTLKQVSAASDVYSPIRHLHKVWLISNEEPTNLCIDIWPQKLAIKNRSNPAPNWWYLEVCVGGYLNSTADTWGNRGENMLWSRNSSSLPSSLSATNQNKVSAVRGSEQLFRCKWCNTLEMRERKERVSCSVHAGTIIIPPQSLFVWCTMDGH